MSRCRGVELSSCRAVELSSCGAVELSSCRVSLYFYFTLFVFIQYDIYFHMLYESCPECLGENVKIKKLYLQSTNMFICSMSHAQNAWVKSLLYQNVIFIINICIFICSMSPAQDAWVKLLIYKIYICMIRFLFL